MAAWFILITFCYLLISEKEPAYVPGEYKTF